MFKKSSANYAHSDEILYPNARANCSLKILSECIVGNGSMKTSIAQ